MDEEPSIPRRLAAILAADIAGYSRLMHADEAATVQALKAHQRVILPLIGRHGGRLIDTAGDGILAAFPSVISATECAVAMQTVMAQRNAGVPESRRMRFRIGITLGDVLYDDTRIFGRARPGRSVGRGTGGRPLSFRSLTSGISQTYEFYRS